MTRRKMSRLSIPPPDTNDLASILTYCGAVGGGVHVHQPIRAFGDFMSDMIWGKHGNPKAKKVWENYNSLYKETKGKPDNEAMMIYARAFLEHTIYENTFGKIGRMTGQGQEEEKRRTW
jgi:hypothetical protein